MTLPPGATNTPNPARRPLPVLGLFANEDELRDHLAAHLDLIETGLTLLDTEYPLDNADGSGGRIDILARDELDHIVCIEVKRSDNSARSTLNELSKYVTLLVARDRVPREMIRCIVVSTHWHELLLPLSYFAYTTGIDTTALQAVRAGHEVSIERLELTHLRFLPQLSPDMDLIRFDERAPREQSLELIKARSAELPFVRLAVLLFEPERPADGAVASFPMLVCVWRLPDGRHDEVAATIGRPIGVEFPYVAPGWELEADAKNWISDEALSDIPQFAQGWTHGTPEKLHATLARHKLTRIERIGDWPQLEIINDDQRILRAALATSPLGGSERGNRHIHRAVVSPLIASSWRAGIDAFLAFIAFEPSWRDAAEEYLQLLEGSDVRVELHAFDKKHVVYAIHQAQTHPDAMLGYFEIIVRAGERVVDGMHGYYTWDGETRPVDAAAVIDAIYGDVSWARLSIGSAVDDRRYESANPLHGFIPVIDWIDEEGRVVGSPPPVRLSLHDFVMANPDYSRGVTANLERLGPLPTDPSAQPIG